MSRILFKFSALNESVENGIGLLAVVINNAENFRFFVCVIFWFLGWHGTDENGSIILLCYRRACELYLFHIQFIKINVPQLIYERFSQ